VAVPEARLILDTAVAAGAARHVLLGHAGIHPADLEDHDARLPQINFDRLVEQAVRLSGDLDLGLHAAERTLMGHRLPDPLHYGLRSCATVGEQLRMVNRYARLVHADATATFAADGSASRMTYDPPGSSAVARRHLAERWLAGLVLLVRRHAGAAFRPREVWFRHPATPDTSTHWRIFGGTPRFEQDVDALVVGHEVLDVPVRDGDARLQKVLDAYLATILPEVRPARLSDLVRRQVRERAPGRGPTVRTVAAALAMSPRSLQRGLAGEGTSYHELLAEVREDLARQLLAESRLSTSEIAFTLGFSEVSTFHRAFKRWTAQTPVAYRHAGRGVLGQFSGAPGQDRHRTRE
jgi:AraC-like DNA-binding protein